MLIQRKPPAIEDLSRSLQARIARDVCRPSEERVISQERRERSLHSCHRYSLNECKRYPQVRDTGAYIPEMSARLENDLNIMALEGLPGSSVKSPIVIGIAQSLGLQFHISPPLALKISQRTVQRHLRELEAQVPIPFKPSRGAREVMHEIAGIFHHFPCGRSILVR